MTGILSNKIKWYFFYFFFQNVLFYDKERKIRSPHIIMLKEKKNNS